MGAEKARNPTDVAIIEKRLAAEERGLAASKVEEEVALENKETEEAAKGVKEVKNTTKKEVKVVEKKVPVAANVSGCGECFNGKCTDGICLCKEGWMGKSCNKQTCGKGCVHGTCLNGACECDVDKETGLPAFFGQSCELRQCPGSFVKGEFKACSGNGACMSVGDKAKDAVCDCQDGYSRSDCSLATTTDESSPIADCNSKCVSKCQKKSGGNSDKYLNCFGKGEWTGRDCSVPVCPNLCSGKGKCRQGACKCDEGYSGKDCSTFDSQYECPKACNQRGACVDKKCKCKIGFEGKACEFIKCPAKC